VFQFVAEGISVIYVSWFVCVCVPVSADSVFLFTLMYFVALRKCVDLCACLRVAGGCR